MNNCVIVGKVQNTHLMNSAPVQILNFCAPLNQALLRDKIVASHTCFGGHMDVNCKLVYELSDVPDDLKWTTNIHMTPFTLIFKA